MRSMGFGEAKDEAKDEAGSKLQSSVAAAILMSSPSMMINFALSSFLTGIGVYLGFVWKNDLDALASRSESRNVFICFLISLVFCSSFYGFPFLSKLWEDNLKSVGNYIEFCRTFEEEVTPVIVGIINVTRRTKFIMLCNYFELSDDLHGAQSDHSLVEDESEFPDVHRVDLDVHEVSQVIIPLLRDLLPDMANIVMAVRVLDCRSLQQVVNAAGKIRILLSRNAAKFE